MRFDVRLLLACVVVLTCSPSPSPNACSGGSTLCAGSCHDLQEDPSHCGTCGNVCAAGNVCFEGQCRAIPTTACADSDPTATAQTYDYVINSFAIEDNVDFNQPHTGFNVDGVYSPTQPYVGPFDCGHQDFFSTVDTDQNIGSCSAGAQHGGLDCHGGVDNQFPEMVQTEAAVGWNTQMVLSNEAAHGQLSMLVRVTDVNGTPGPGMSDCSVGVRVYYGHPTATDCSTIFSGSGVFAVDDSSLTTPGDLSSARYAWSAQIINGRLRVTASDPTVDNILPFPVLPLSVTQDSLLAIHRLQIRATLTAAAGSDGNLGGYLIQTETVARFAEALPQYASLVGSVVGGLVDVATGSPLDCGNTPTADGGVDPNGGIGFGMGFTMVSAVIAPTTVSGPPAGACGSTM